MINLREELQKNADRWKNKDYIYEKRDGKYQPISYGLFLEKSREIAGYLLGLGLLGKHIMLYGENSTELMMADLAVLEYVGVSAWVSKEWLASEVLGAVEFLGVSCIIYGAEKQSVVEVVKEKHPEIICISTRELRDFAGGMKSNTKLEMKPDTEWETCCKIVFSSGTTAEPKAVMLSKKNIFAGLEPLYRRCPFGEHDVDYLFLPLNHTYGGIYNFLYSLVLGFSIYLCSDIEKIGQELSEVQPTMFCGVPLIYKRLYQGYGENIKEVFGTRIRYLFCGGAPFGVEMRKAYRKYGLHIMEAYALSETSSTFSIQYPDDTDLQTVGTIAENLDVIIDRPDPEGCGEILVKGDNVFLGYAGNLEKTKQCFTADGYFRTGDRGYLREDELHGGNRLYLVGRIKKQLVLENGETVEPESIEKQIKMRDTNIKKVSLFLQEGRLGCKAYLREEEDRNWDNFFSEINAALPRYEHIKHYDVILDSAERRWKE